MHKHKAQKGARRFAALLAAGAALLGGVSAPVWAQKAPTIGVVDGVKINEGYTKLKDALAAIDKQNQELGAQIEARLWMSEADTKRFGALIVNTKRNKGENAELAKLVKSGTDRGAEHQNLMGKATKTDADKARLTVLEDEAKRLGAGLEEIAKKVRDAMIERENSTQEQYRNEIVKSVEQIAKQKQLVLVVGKQAVAWNAETVEITTEVLALLNKG